MNTHSDALLAARLLLGIIRSEGHHHLSPGIHWMFSSLTTAGPPENSRFWTCTSFYCISAKNLNLLLSPNSFFILLEKYLNEAFYTGLIVKLLVIFTDVFVLDSSYQYLSQAK